MIKESKIGVISRKPIIRERIMRFVDNGEMPLTDISPAGAVGKMLNWYFNHYLQTNRRDYKDFTQNNPQMHPILLLKVLGSK